MTIPTVLGGDRKSELTWDVMSLRRSRRFLSLAVFALVYALLVVAGHGLHEDVEQLTILWPAAGLLFLALWFSPPRNWIWILAIQLTVEIAVDAAQSDHFSVLQYAPFAIANSLDAAVGAFVAGRLITNPEIPRIRQVMQFFGAVALGAAASAVLGAFGTVRMLAGTHYLREWQLWWAGNWLGSLSIAPVVLCWAVRWRAPARSVPPAPAVEVLLMGAALLGLTIWAFASPPGRAGTNLDPPFLLLALMVVAAFRLPPRWSTTLAAAVSLVASYLASRGLGPFAADPNPFVLLGAAQLYLATLVVINFMLTVVLLEMRNTLQLLGTAGERYRNFVEHSSEAVWRIELRAAMPNGLPVSEQIAWLREHAYIAECNALS